MDDEIPPEFGDEPLSNDSENSSNDEFPADDQFDSPLDEEFDVQEPGSNLDDQIGDDEGLGFEENVDLDAEKPVEEISLDQVDVSSVPIQIDLELTRIKVTLSELQRMQPGQKVPINVNPRIINLVVGGKMIGKGEIVNIGDAACVKVIELYK